MDIVDEYLKKTRQSFQYLMSGSVTFGPNFIIAELVPQALKEKKKIGRVAHLIKGLNLG